MRNIVKYPITESEIVECLERLSKEILDEGSCGDIRPLCLKAAAEIVQAAGELLRGIDRRLADPNSTMRYVTPWAEATKLVKALKSPPS
jgi:hypothetical protein